MRCLILRVRIHAQHGDASFDGHGFSLPHQRFGDAAPAQLRVDGHAMHHDCRLGDIPADARVLRLLFIRNRRYAGYAAIYLRHPELLLRNIPRKDLWIRIGIVPLQIAGGAHQRHHAPNHSHHRRHIVQRRSSQIHIFHPKPCYSRSMFDPAAGSDTALLFTEQVLVLATIIGSVAAMPSFIEFITERRKRRERIDLSLEDEPVEQLHPRLAGMDDLLRSIEDLVDRARFPQAYQDLKIGNEVLIIGPSQSGKKSLAQTLAKMTSMERLITVYNQRDSDALAEAKSLLTDYKRRKVMLLLPRIDLAYKESDPEVLTELDALIESASERQNVLVIATAVSFEPDSALDNLFGIKLALPGAEVIGVNRRIPPAEAAPEIQQMMGKVARFYLAEAQRRGFRLEGISEDQFCSTVLADAMNPAEIEDIITLCETTALFRRRTVRSDALILNREILETAIARVVIG